MSAAITIYQVEHSHLTQIPGSFDSSDSLRRRVDRLVKDEMSRRKIPGVAVVALHAGKIAGVGIYGWADRARRLPVTTSTVFRLQSLSKPFTAEAVTILAEDGKIHLDDPVNRYLKACPESWRNITVRNLLNQTSGLRDFINEPALDLRRELTEEQLATALAGQPLKFQPGEQWDYSNSNYLLLGMIIGRVTGQWYGDFLADRIFLPLGMTQTVAPRTPHAVPNRAIGYTLVQGQIRPSEADMSLANSVLSYAGGGVDSTILDMAKWETALHTGQLLGTAALSRLWIPAKLNNGDTYPYGMGWQISTVAGHRLISCSGTWTGFAAEIERYVDDQLTVIVLTNLAESEPGRIARRVAGVFVPAIAPPAYPPIADHEPAVTARLFDVLRQVHDGDPRAGEFTPAVWGYLSSHSEQMGRDFAAIGPIQKLVLVERSESGGELSYRYRAYFSHTTMIFHFVLTGDGRISAMTPEEVNQQ